MSRPFGIGGAWGWGSQAPSEDGANGCHGAPSGKVFNGRAWGWGPHAPEEDGRWGPVRESVTATFGMVGARDDRRPQAPDRNLAMDLVRVTEAAAMAAAEAHPRSGL